METYNTRQDTNLVKVEVTCESLAVKMGSVVFSLKSKSDPFDFIELENVNDSTWIEKGNLYAHNVFEAVTHFALDSAQMPNKMEIIKGTKVFYAFSEEGMAKNFITDHTSFSHEYKDGGSNVFRVTKKIELVIDHPGIVEENDQNT
ncbi:MAG: hypothetical protein CL868_06635 [Cytophagaceae bacterium]|nr:hypothetical protein [Cytophagaceae bacterium]|tara:strand:+ start:2773 stop:3210 length:438 start_codon:yes stop_codon:yes gene_type:complete